MVDEIRSCLVFASADSSYIGEEDPIDWFRNFPNTGAIADNLRILSCDYDVIVSWKRSIEGRGA